MSRGLGVMQRDILEVYDRAVPQPRGLMGGALPYDRGDIQSYGELTSGVVALYDAWCTRARRSPACYWCYLEMVRYPHVNAAIMGRGFEVSLSRALHSLVQRGLLAAVTEAGWPHPSRGCRIPAVVRI